MHKVVRFAKTTGAMRMESGLNRTCIEDRFMSFSESHPRHLHTPLDFHFQSRYSPATRTPNRPSFSIQGSQLIALHEPNTILYTTGHKSPNQGSKSRAIHPRSSEADLSVPLKRLAVVRREKSASQPKSGSVGGRRICGVGSPI